MNSLKNLPRPLIVISVLILGVILIMVTDPPKTVCDAQLDVFLQEQKGRMTSLKGNVGSLWARSAKFCKETQSSGGCLEFFNTTKQAVKDIHNAPDECIPRLLEEEWLYKSIKDSIILMVQLAWGAKIPEPGPSVFNWMTFTEFALFCDLQRTFKKPMLDDEWEVFVRGVIAKLPGSNQLTFNESFERSLFSLRCEVIN